MPEGKIEYKNVSFLLGMLIIFMPYFGAWFTLKEGYSFRVRVFSFIYLVLIVVGLVLAPSSPKTTNQKEVYAENAVTSSCEAMFFVSDEAVKKHPRFCTLQHELLQEKYMFYKSFLDSNVCKVYDDLINRFGSREDVRRVMVATYAGTSQENSREAQLAAGAFTHCKNQDSKDMFINERLADVQIFSIGEYMNQGMKCDGLLYQEGSNGSRIYQLISLGKCGEIKMDNVFHPDRNPYGKKHSSAYKEIGYSGELPKDWMWHNKVYPF